jgi:dihydroxyacetone kinase-like predicted kinase
LDQVWTELFGKNINKKYTNATIFYGRDTNISEAQKIKALLDDKYGINVDIINGGQPSYYFVIGFSNN